MAAVPTEIWILGKWWSIIDDTDILDEQEELGLTKAHVCEIRYNSRQDEQQLRDTIHHELLHALFHETGLTNEIKDEKIDLTEESIVRRLATAQLAMLRDNPDYLKYITTGA